MPGLLDPFPPLHEPIPMAPPPQGMLRIGRMEMPAPQAVELPRPPAVPQSQGVRGRIHDALQNYLVGSTPQGYEGLLTPDEIKSAKPSLLESLFTTPNTPTYQQRLDAMVQRKLLAQQVQQGNVAQVRNSQMLAARDAVFKEIPPPTSGSDEDMGVWANQVLPRLMAAGDYEAVKQLAPLAKSYADRGAGGGEQQAQLGNFVSTFKPGKGIYNPETGKWEAAVAKKEPDSVVAHKQALEDAANARIDASYARLAAMGEQFKAKQLMAEGKDFNARVKPLRDRAAVIEQALTTIEDAAHNPDPKVRRTLYTSTVANFVQAADQKAQVRFQLLNYFKNNVDPSIGGKWEVLKSRLLKGELPGYTMEGMLIHLSNLRDLTRKEIETQRNDVIKRKGPDVEDFLPTMDTFFPTMAQDAAPSGATAPAGPDLFKKWGITPVRKP